jgi:hypothetical protein
MGDISKKGRSKLLGGGRVGFKRGGGISETSKKQSLELREKKKQKFIENLVKSGKIEEAKKEGRKKLRERRVKYN